MSRQAQTLGHLLLCLLNPWATKGPLPVLDSWSLGHSGAGFGRASPCPQCAMADRLTDTRGPVSPKARPDPALSHTAVPKCLQTSNFSCPSHPTLCHGLIPTALEKGEPAEHPQGLCDIMVWGTRHRRGLREGRRESRALVCSGSPKLENPIPKARQN